LTPRLEHDVLAVNGDAVIAGTVLIRFIDGFVPNLGDTYQLFEVSGTLDLSGAVFVIESAPGISVELDPETGEIVVIPECDDHGLLDNPNRVPGDIKVRVKNGTLDVKGDKHDNAFRIITALNGDVIVEGLGGTTLNGQAEPLLVFTAGQVFDDLRIDTKDGQDFVCLSHLVISDDLTIHTGGETDAVSLVNVDVGGKLTIHTNGGGDFIDVTNTSAERNTKLLSGSGGDQIAIVSSHFSEDLTVLTDGGDDTIELSDVSVGEATRIFSGAGDDVLRLRDVSLAVSLISLGLGNDGLLVADSTIRESFLVLPGLGKDVVDLENNTFQNRVVVESWLGHLAVRVRENRFQDDVDFQAGIFSDDVFLDDGSNSFSESPDVKGFNDFSNDLIDAAFSDLLELAFD
ncbi:MAG: hypothetical protein KDA84_29630, partial [Planctomycetaceae bacterium]|nr:hypothetical protein [Planctomycetaceae bacterium]